MPEGVGKGSTDRGRTRRSAATGRYLGVNPAKTSTGRPRVKNVRSMTWRPTSDKTAIPGVIVVDKYRPGPTRIASGVYAPAQVSNFVPELLTGERAPHSALPSVQEYAKSVLTTLSDILVARLGAIVAADIDLNSLGTPEHVAEWLASALPSSHAFDDVAGPFYEIGGLARRCGLPPAEVLELTETNMLLGCPTADGTLVFPVSQFNPDGSVVAGLPQVLGEMAEGTSDRWQVALWLNTPFDELRGLTPAQALRRGDTESVLELAGETAARWRH